MKILLINHYAGSPDYGMEYRPFYLSREWVRMGCEVTIVAASFSHLRSRQPTINGVLSEEMIEGIRYQWIRTPAYEGNGVKRVVNMTTFVATLMRHARRFARDFLPDAVIASSTYPLDVYPARRIARQVGAKLVFEVHDLWPLTPMKLGGMSAWHPYIMLLQRAEDFYCRRADKIVSMLPRANLHLCTRGMDIKKYVHIPNGVALDGSNDSAGTIPDEYESHLSAFRRQGRMIVGYAGGHGVSNALHVLLEAAAKLRDENVSFVLIGQGTERDALISEKNRQRLDNVLFLPPLPKASVPAFLRRMDILYLGWNDSPLYQYGISPNKLMDYMLAAKPIVHSVNAANDCVAESQCGISVPAGNSEAVANAISELMTVPHESLSAMGSRGREYVVKNYDYRRLASQFLSVLG